MRLGAPGAVMMALEAWSFETSTLLAGLIRVVPLASHMVLINIVGFTFLSFPFALGIASSIRVGWLLGAGSGAAAKHCGKVCFMLMVGFMLLLSLGKIAARHQLGRIFSDDAAVIATVADLVFIAALFQVSDGCQASVAGDPTRHGPAERVRRLELHWLWGDRHRLRARR